MLHAYFYNFFVVYLGYSSTTKIVFSRQYIIYINQDFIFSLFLHKANEEKKKSETVSTKLKSKLQCPIVSQNNKTE